MAMLEIFNQDETLAGNFLTSNCGCTYREATIWLERAEQQYMIDIECNVD
jgi:hypothetical protein